MKEFKTKLENLLKDACIVFEKHDLPLEPWIKLDRTGKSGTSFSEEQVIDRIFFPKLLHQYFMYNDLFRGLCTSVIQNSDLSKLILKDEMGIPITEPLNYDVKISRDIVAPFFIDYFYSINKPIFDQQLFDQKFHELNEILHRDFSTYISISPLLNFDMTSDSYQIDKEIRIRKLTTEELEEWINPIYNLGDSDLYSEKLSYTYCCIEINSSYKSLTDIDILEKRELPYRLVNLLNLIFEKNIYILLNEEYYIGPYLPYSSGKIPSRGQFLGKEGQILKLDDNSITQLNNLWQLLSISPNSDLIRLAFNRLSNTAFRFDETDQILDYWIGLESLFTPDPAPEISYRAAIRISSYLGDTSEEREKIYDDVRHSYAWRSAIVHGNLFSSKKIKKLNQKGTLSDTVIKTRSYLRKAILKLLKSSERFDPSVIERNLLRNTKM